MSDGDAKLIGAGLGCVGGIGLILVIGAFTAWVVSLLYNGIVVPMFGFPPLTWLQIWGITILINLVFGGLRTVTTSKDK